MATLTINTTAQQDARISEAFGEYLGLGRNATLQEVRAAIIDYLKSTTVSYELKKARQAVTPNTFDIT